MRPRPRPQPKASKREDAPAMSEHPRIGSSQYPASAEGRRPAESNAKITRRSMLPAPLLLLGSGSARAQRGWPARPIRIVCPYAPAGGSDVCIR